MLKSFKKIVTFGVLIFLILNDANAMTWTAMNNGLTSQNINAMVSYEHDGTFISTLNIYVATQHQGIFLSVYSNSATPWVSQGLVGNNIYALALIGGTTLYAGTNNNVYVGTLETNGSVSSWTPSTLNNIYVTCLFYDPVGNVMYAGTAGEGVYAMNLNTPNEWSSLGLDNINITSLFVQNSTLFVGTHANGIYTLSVATPNTNWINVYQSSVPITGFSAGYFSSGSVAAGTLGQGVINSSNNGETWQNISTGLTNLNVLSMNDGIVGTAGGGIYEYNDTVPQWNAYGPTGMNITSSFLNGNFDQGGLAYVSTQGNGVYMAAVNS